MFLYLGVLLISGASILSGCAFLNDRPEDLGRFAQCQKVGCL